MIGDQHFLEVLTMFISMLIYTETKIQ